MEGDSLMFPHPCVLLDSLYVNNYERRASRSIVSPKIAPFLLVGNLYTLILIDTLVYFGFLVVNMVVKR